MVRCAVLTSCLLAACGRFDFDPRSTSDASAPDAVPDAALPVCTSPCMIADSQNDFVGVQGSNGWVYGYWWLENDADATYDASTDFTEMAWTGSLWHPPDYNADPMSPDFTWAYEAAWGGHPGSWPQRKLPVRRWVSNVSGLAALTVHHAKSDATGGDGTRVIVYRDGVEIWRHDVDGLDGVGVTQDLPVLLNVGTKIDVMLHYIGDDAVDTTDLWMTVHDP